MLSTHIIKEKKSVAGFVLCGLLIALAFWASLGWWGLRHRIHIGERREGLLRASDPIIKEVPPGPQTRWVFDGHQGQQVIISSESYEFDIYLLLLDPLGQQIGWSDNNGRFFNARIQTTLPITGQYTAIVCGANEDQFGVYWISLEAGNSEADWSEAAMEAYFAQGLEWCARKGSDRGASWLNLGMAQYFRERRQWDKAEKYYADSLAKARQSDFIYGQWAATLDRSRLLTSRRQAGPAVSQLEQALELSKRLKSSSQAQTRVLIEFGNFYYSTARSELARVYFRSAEKQSQQSMLPSILVDLYTSLNGILQVEEKEKAIDYAEKAYSFSDGVDPATRLNAVHVLAGTYLFLKPGKSADGTALAVEMRNRARQLGFPYQEVEATILLSLEKYLTNNLDEMINLAREAVDLTNPADEDPGPRRIALQLQADGEMLKGNYGAALKSCLETLQAVETAWAKESIEELRRELLSQANVICTQIIRNLYPLNAGHSGDEYARQAFDYAERSRSRSLLEQLALANATTSSEADPQALKRDRESLNRLSAVRGQLVLLRSSGSASLKKLYDLQEERAGLIAERMRLQAEIRRSTENHLYVAQLAPLTAEQVQQKLSESMPNGVLLCYQLGIQDSFLIVLTPRGVHLFKLPDRGTISKAVTEWRAHISNQLKAPSSTDDSLDAYTEVADRLYKMLIQPAAHLIHGRDLIIVPSDSLQDLAFETLIVDKRKTEGHPRYLIEEHAVTYVPSASVMAAIENRRENTARDKLMLLVSGAADDKDSDLPGVAADQLPAARQEILDIASVSKQSGIKPTILLGSQATKEAITHTDLSVYNFIHLITHSISDDQDGGASALKLFKDPARDENDILTSDEIARLKLNTDLLVLSGCETGTGQKAGAEGVFGLSRTFLIAGTQRVCASLWRVDDFWTQKLMSVFYEKFLAERLSKSQALRSAKLKLLKQGASPAQWAAFVLIGQPH